MISTEFKHTFKIEKLVTFVHVIIEKKNKVKAILVYKATSRTVTAVTKINPIMKH